MHELVIRGGRVVDGTGAKPRDADLAITDGHITAVGDDVGPARRTIDADGRLVTPGFVDVHTHYDAQATWDPELTPSSWHGVTTVVFGNCGVGFAPAHVERRDQLIALMEGVEDIPGSALAEGLTWGWQTFPEYLDELARLPRVMDVGAQVAHAPLRVYVMGDRGARDEPATGDDRAEMARLTEEALRAGALGFTTSRTSLHKALDGSAVPGTTAARDELFAIGGALSRAGHGVFHAACEHASVPDEIPWLAELSRATGRAVSFSLSQIDAAPDLWRRNLALLDDEVARGAQLYAQVAGRSIGIVMTLAGSAHPLLALPTYLELLELPLTERVARMRDPIVRARLVDEQPISLWPFADFVTRTYGKMFPANATNDVDYEPTVDGSVAAIATRTGKKANEIILDALLAHDGHGIVYFPLFNYADGSLDLLHELHRHPRTVMGLSDAGAHCGAICDGGMPTFMLTHWARDRARGGRLPLEHVVARQTSRTAALYGLHDRGVLAPGYRADVNVIDLNALSFDAPRMAYDLPAGGRRLVQRARGYAFTLVNGVVVRESDEATGERPGRLIRGPQRRPTTTDERAAARPRGAHLTTERT